MKRCLYSILSALLFACIPAIACAQNTTIGAIGSQEVAGSITADNSGNMYVAGKKNKAGLVVKQDAGHNTIWSKTLSFSADPAHNTIIAFMDVMGDTVFGCGYVRPDNSGFEASAGSFFFKLNAQTGNVYWTKSDLTARGYFFCMRYANGKYLLTGGTTGISDLQRGKVIAVSSQTGNLIWETPDIQYQVAGLETSFRTRFMHATELISGKMYITGTGESNGTGAIWRKQPLLVGIDESGTIFLKKFMQGDGQLLTRCDGQQIVFDGNSLVIAFNNASPTSVNNETIYSGILKCNLQGIPIICQAFPLATNSTTMIQGINVANNSYVIYGLVFGNYDGAFLLKVSTTGIAQACKTIHKPNVQYLTGNEYSWFTIGGNNVFSNGHHYFPVSESAPGVDYNINKIIVDENLENPDDCTLFENMATSMIQLPVTMETFNPDQRPAHVVLQDGAVITDTDVSASCGNLHVDLVQQAVCTTSEITADAVNFAAPTYTWSNGATGNQVTVSTTDTLFVTVTDIRCCTLTDTIVPVINPSTLAVSLPADTIVCRQPSNAFTITPVVTGANGAVHYAWSNGTSAAALPVTVSGTYWVDVSDACVTVRDSIHVEIRSLPTITHPATLGVCTGNFPTNLNPVVSAATTISWNDGPTTVVRPVAAPGSYTINAVNSCGSAQLTIAVTEIPLPEVQLPALIDTCICAGGDFLLVPLLSSVSDTWWSDGTHTDQLTVSAPGNYTVYGANQCGIDSATCTIAINYYPELFLPAVLDTCFNLETGFSYTAQGSPGTYQWSSGFATATVWITEVGTYTCTLTNVCGTVTGTMIVNRFSEISIYADDSVNVCDDRVAVLGLGIETNYDMELFSASGLLQEDVLTESGWYYIHAFNDCNSAMDSIFVNLQYQKQLYLPNTFTPNGDAFNEVFRYEGENITIREIEIFNRWGETVYTESGNFTGWDGTYQGKPCQDGIYVVHVIYDDCAGNGTAFNGHVSLLR